MFGASKRAQQVKPRHGKPENLHISPWSPCGGRRDPANCILSSVPCSPHMRAHTVYIQKNLKVFFLVTLCRCAGLLFSFYGDKVRCLMLPWLLRDLLCSSLLLLGFGITMYVCTLHLFPPDKMSTDWCHQAPALQQPLFLTQKSACALVQTAPALRPGDPCRLKSGCVCLYEFTLLDY